MEYRVRHKSGRITLAHCAWHGDSRSGWYADPVRRQFLRHHEMKQAEERLRESEQRWRSLAEMLPQFVWTSGPDGMVDYFSAKTTEYTGVAESELVGLGWLDALHPDDRDYTAKTMVRKYEAATPARGRTPHSSCKRRISLVYDARGACSGQRWACLQMVRHEHRHHGTEGNSRRTCVEPRSWWSSRYAARRWGSSTSTCRTVRSRTVIK